MKIKGGSGGECVSEGVRGGCFYVHIMYMLGTFRMNRYCSFSTSV